MLLALAMGAIAVVQFYFVGPETGLPFADFLVFWTAARLPDAQVYDPVAVTQAASWYYPALAPRPFSYPPSALALFRLFGGLNFFMAAWLWTGLGVGGFFIAVWRWGGTRVALMSLLTTPALYALTAGQTTLAIGALVAGAATQLERRPWLAGALIAAAALIKPQLLILAPVTLALSGRWVALAGAITMGSAIAGVCILIQGPAFWWSWAEALTHFLDQAAAADVLGSNFTPAGIGSPLASIGGVALGLLVAWRAAHLPASFTLHGAILASFLVLPYAMPYDLAVIAPIACLWLLDRDGPALGWAVGLAILSALTGAVGLLAGAAFLIWFSLRPAANLKPIPVPPRSGAAVRVEIVD